MCVCVCVCSCTLLSVAIGHLLPFPLHSVWVPLLSADQDGFLLFIFFSSIFALILLWRNWSEAAEIHNAHHRECDHFVRHENGCNVVLDFWGWLACWQLTSFSHVPPLVNSPLAISNVSNVSLYLLPVCAPSDSVLRSILLYVVQSSGVCVHSEAELVVLRLRIHRPIRGLLMYKRQHIMGIEQARIMVHGIYILGPWAR